MPRPLLSRPSARARRGGAVAALALGVVLAGCAEAPSRTELTDALVTSGVPTDVARCAADAITDTLSEDQIVQIVERGPGGAPPDDPKDQQDASDRVRAALAECRADLPAATTTVPATVPGAVPSTTVPGTTVPISDGGTGDTSVPASTDADGDGTGPVFDTVPSTTEG